MLKKKKNALPCECHSKGNFLPHLSLKLLKRLHLPSKKLFYMYKCRTCFHNFNSVSFLPDCPTCSEFETLWQTVQGLKEQVAYIKMQCIIIFCILAKYGNPAGLSRENVTSTIPPLSRFVDYRALLSRMKYSETLRGLEFNKCIPF